jgi:hypothetical protein
MKLTKENIITEVIFKNGKGFHLGEYAFDGIITGFDKIDDYIIEVQLADGFEGWAIYLDVNGKEVEYND